MGNASLGLVAVAAVAVHPHGCGERHDPDIAATTAHGSSPRVWGPLSRIKNFIFIPRFIPTGVGNAVLDAGAFIPITVHPHGCGERFRRWRIKCRRFGSSPRVWGTLRLFFKFHLYTRFIPTGVGNASVVHNFVLINAVHPHGCGERSTVR